MSPSENPTLTSSVTIQAIDPTRETFQGKRIIKGGETPTRGDLSRGPFYPGNNSDWSDFPRESFLRLPTERFKIYLPGSDQLLTVIEQETPPRLGSVATQLPTSMEVADPVETGQATTPSTSPADIQTYDSAGNAVTTTSSNTPSSIKDGQSTENVNIITETESSALSTTISTGTVAQATSNDDTGNPIAAAPLTIHEAIKAATKEAMAEFRREMLAERQLHNEEMEARMQEIEHASSKRMVLYLGFTSIVWLAVSSRDSWWV